MQNMVRKMAVAGAVVAVTSVSGCGLREAIIEQGNGHMKTVSYESGLEGKNDDDAKLPAWVPDGAQQVEEVIRTTGTERILKYRPAGTALPSLCTSGNAEAVPPTLTADWWPAGEHKRTNKVCDGWHVAVEQDAVYAYRAESLLGN